MTRLLLASAAIGLALAAPAQARDQIRIVGSSTVFPFSTAVAEQFARKTGGPAPVVESTGSGGGIQIFCSGVGENTPDITNSSRRIEQSELDMCAQNGVQEVVEVKVGYDGIVLASSSTGEEFGLTVPQLWLALAREVPVNGQMAPNPYRSWNEVDASLPDEAIEVLGPPPTSGTRDAFVELVMEVGCESFPEVEALDEDAREEACAAMREDGVYVDAGENDNLIVQRLQANPQAVGIFGFSFLDQNADTLTGHPIAGEEPTFENIASGAYPVSRSLYFYVKKAHIGVVPGIEEYTQEFLSDEASGEEGYLADRGLIPMPAEEHAQVDETVKAMTPLTSVD